MSRLAMFVLVCLCFTLVTVGPMVVEAAGVPREHQWGVLMAGAVAVLLLWALWFCLVEGWP